MRFKAPYRASTEWNLQAKKKKTEEAIKRWYIGSRMQYRVDGKENSNHAANCGDINTHCSYLSLKKRRKPKAMSLSIASSTKVEVKK